VSKKLLLLIMFCFCFYTFAFHVKANEQASTEQDKQNEFQPLIKKGNIGAGGSASIAYSTYSNFIYNISPNLEYFLIDRLSLGGTANYTVTSGQKSLSLGPSFTYYFCQSGRWIPLTGLGLYYTDIFSSSYYSSDFNYWNGKAKLGINYFLTPSIAIGSVFEYYRTFFNKSSGVQDTDSGQILFQFFIYL
jgi:hypothetical protein